MGADFAAGDRLPRPGSEGLAARGKNLCCMVHPLKLPGTLRERTDFAIRQQQFFGKRFPTQPEFLEFLRVNRNYQYDESSYHECAMSYFGGGPVSEGHTSDIDQAAPDWFRRFESATRAKASWTGRELHDLLFTL